MLVSGAAGIILTCNCKSKKVKKAVLNRKAAKGLIRKDQKQRKEVYERKEK